MMLSTIFILMFWIAVMPPAVPQKLPFGPFYSVEECENAYTWARQHYVGSGTVQHECKPVAKS